MHVSDSQLKEHRVRLEGPLGEDGYDALASGVYRNTDLEEYAPYELLALTLSVNELARSTEWLGPGFAPCPAPAPPRFVVHTGDAVDSGMFSELLEQLTVMGELAIPYYAMVGNHDGLFFGTFPPEEMAGTNVVLPFVPIGNPDRFIRFHNPEGADFQSDLSLPASGWRSPHAPTVLGGCDQTPAPDSSAPAVRCLPPSSYHGFDLACERAATSGLCPEAKGYYALELPLPAAPSAGPRALSLLFLNTAQIQIETMGAAIIRHGAEGKMHPEQLRWLERQLADRGDGVERLVLVLGHHRLSDFAAAAQGRELERILRRSPRVLAYLCGHTHNDEVAAFSRTNGPPLWQLTAGSTLVFPQLARLVELLEDPTTGAVYVRLASFRPQLGERRGLVDPACKRLGCLAQKARRGAEADTADGDWASESAAADAASAILLVRK